MSRRLVGFALLLVGVLVHVGVTLPARRARDEARAAYAGKREERERLRADLARLERRSSARGSSASEDGAAAARALRHRLLLAIEGLALGDVQIASRPEQQSGAAARGRLSALGRQADVLRAADRLADPGSGVVLERLDLVQRSGGVQLDADAMRLRGGP